MGISMKEWKPEMFVIVTCDPNWPDIQMHLAQGQTAIDLHIFSSVFFE